MDGGATVWLHDRSRELLPSRLSLDDQSQRQTIYGQLRNVSCLAVGLAIGAVCELLAPESAVELIAAAIVPLPLCLVFFRARK